MTDLVSFCSRCNKPAIYIDFYYDFCGDKCETLHYYNINKYDRVTCQIPCIGYECTNDICYKYYDKCGKCNLFCKVKASLGNIGFCNDHCKTLYMNKKREH